MHRLFAPFLFVLLIMGLYLYAEKQTHRQSAQAARLGSLRGRILAYVKEHPEFDRVSLEQLGKAGVLTPDDLKFFQESGVTYHAIGARSPSETVFLVQRQNNQEWRWRKDGRPEFRVAWPSPDRAFAVVNAPGHTPGHRTLTVEDRLAGRVLATREVEGSAIKDAIWSPDSHFVAINLPAPGGPPASPNVECRLVYEVSPGSAREIGIPLAELRPARLLDPEHAGQPVQWYDSWVMAQRWRRANELIVQSQGRGRLGDPAKGPTKALNLIDLFVICVQQGQASVLEHTRRYYAVAPP